MTYTGKIPGKRRRLLTLVALSTQSKIAYTANAFISFNVSFSGFLRWSGNARKDHPTDRPFVTVNFGDDSKSAYEDIVDKYNHRNIPSYSEWDWAWIYNNDFASWMDAVLSSFMGGIGVTLTGKFTNVKGTNVEIKAGEPQPLTESEIATASEAMALEIPHHPDVSPHPTAATSSPLLYSDELLGGRVLLVK